MEKMYDREKYRLLYTKTIDLQKYLKKYSEEVGGLFKIRKKGVSMKSLLGITDDEVYKKLKDIMDPNKAKCTVVPKTFVPKRRFLESWAHYDLPKGTGLATHQFLLKESKPDKSKRLRIAKYDGKIVLDPPRKANEDKYRSQQLFPIHDYLVCLRIEKLTSQAGNPKYKPSQELWVPGKMTLDHIKDRIVCEEDYALTNPLMETPNTFNPQRKMDLNKHGMFYIGKDFFVDTRWRRERDYDYSVEVREWMKSRNFDTGSVESMEVPLSSVHVRLGYPYLYLHQGKCEHLITFTDARLLKYNEVVSMECYPVLKSFASFRGKICVLCLSRLAKVCVTNCDTIPYDVAFICNMCTLCYLYDSEGKKKTPFTLYKYIDRNAIL